MQLKPRSSFVDGRGNIIRIYGVAKSQIIDDKKVYWALHGDWYLEEGTYLYGTKPHPSKRSLVAESDPQESEEFWKGIK